MEKQELFTDRAENIQKIIDMECSGSIEIFAKKINVQVVTVKKYLNPYSIRPCKEKSARKIEICFGLPPYSLDVLEVTTKDIYYIAVYTNTRYIYHTVSSLQKNEYITECSCILGDFDILIKAEVEFDEQIDILQSHIVKFPGVKKTTTLKVVKALHWQKAQPERMKIKKRDRSLYYSNGLEEFIYDKINYHLNKIKELETGEAIAEDMHSISLGNDQIIRGAKISINSTISLKEGIGKIKKYIKTESKLIQAGVSSKKIIFLCEKYKKNWDKITSIYNLFNEIESEVRFVLKDKFIHSELSPKYEQFTIIDNLYACIRRDERDMYLIKRSPEFVDQYISTFSANWNNSLSFNDIETSIHEQ